MLSPGQENCTSKAWVVFGGPNWELFALTFRGKIPLRSMYDTPRRLTRQGMIPQGDFNTNFNKWLAGVRYSGEIDSAQHDTLGRLTLCSMIPHGDWLCVEWYPGRFIKILINKFENWSKFKNILTRWSVAQASLNDEKNWRLKISLDCPFNDNMV